MITSPPVVLLDRIAAVTGASRGFGRGIVRGLLERGARKIYALDLANVVAEPLPDELEAKVVRLSCDVTSQSDADRAVRDAGDIDLLVNNAGFSACNGLLTGVSMSEIEREIEVNYLGTLRVCRAFVPILAQHEGSVVLTIVSSLARAAIPQIGSYCVSKAALLKAMEILRAQLKPSGIRVVTALPGAIDTRMIESLSVRKMRVEEAVALLLDGMERGLDEILVGQEAIDMDASYRADSVGFLDRLVMRCGSGDGVQCCR